VALGLLALIVTEQSLVDEPRHHRVRIVKPGPRFPQRCGAANGVHPRIQA